MGFQLSVSNLVTHMFVSPPSWIYGFCIWDNLWSICNCWLQLPVPHIHSRGNPLLRPLLNFYRTRKQPSFSFYPCPLLPFLVQQFYSFCFEIFMTDFFIYLYSMDTVHIRFFCNGTYQKSECYYSGTFTSIIRIIYNWNSIFLLILCIMIWHRHTKSTLREFKMTSRRNILTISQNIYSSIAYLPNPSIKVPLEILS